MDIEQKVIEFFKKHYRNAIVINQDFVINPPSLLSDEAEIILEDFIKQFGIEKGYLEVDMYFNPLINQFKISDLFRKKDKVPLKRQITVGHMIEVAKKHEWFDPK